MLARQLDILLFFILYHVSYCQRRIEGGAPTTADKPYVVYLIQASLAETDYDYWLCGGALVTNAFILTSAACIEDVKYLYAIAGYNKYVPDKEIDDDRCTQKKKKKIIFTCVPISYNFNYELVEQWSKIDIALARVESPYIFEDKSYSGLCSYIPNKIPINYDPVNVLKETDCIVMGWGHEKTWRKGKDKANYNSEILRYASTEIIDINKCVLEYEMYPDLKPIIEEYMICTQGDGEIDDAGQPKLKTIKDLQHWELLDGCLLDVDDGDRRMGQQNASCLPNKAGDARRMNTNSTRHNYTMYDYIKKAVRERRSSRTRRNGICQNDHGGPLVTWVGSTEVLIGVASVFGVNGEGRCSGPSLHTSTHSNAAFISCVINDYNNTTRRNAMCDSPSNVRGFDMVENHISWEDHPAGAAENEF